MQMLSEWPESANSGLSHLVLVRRQLKVIRVESFDP
jgi:hypothetical protein